MAATVYGTFDCASAVSNSRVSFETRRTLEALATLLAGILLHLTEVLLSHVAQLFLPRVAKNCTKSASMCIAVMFCNV